MTGFYMMGALVVKVLNDFILVNIKQNRAVKICGWQTAFHVV